MHTRLITYIRAAGLALALILTACGAPTTSSDQTAAAPQQSPAARNLPVPSTGPVPTRIAVPSMAALAPDETQRAAMREPQSVVRLWAEQLQNARYDAIEPLLTDSLRQAFAMRQPGGAPAWYAEQARQRGPLSRATVGETRTPFDTDDLVAIDVTLAYAQGTETHELDVVRTAQGWQIDNWGPRPSEPIASITVGPDIRATLSDPEQTARFFADLLQAERFDDLLPIWTLYGRTTFGSGAALPAQFRADAQQYGKLTRYNIVGSALRPDDWAEVKLDLQYERATIRSLIVLNKTPQGWKINHIVPRP